MNPTMTPREALILNRELILDKLSDLRVATVSADYAVESGAVCMSGVAFKHSDGRAFPASEYDVRFYHDDSMEYDNYLQAYRTEFVPRGVPLSLAAAQFCKLHLTDAYEHGLFPERGRGVITLNVGAKSVTFQHPYSTDESTDDETI